MCQRGSMIDIDARPYFSCQRTKGSRIVPVKVQIKDCFGIGQIVLCQIVVETRTGGSKVGNACRYTARDRKSEREGQVQVSSAPVQIARINLPHVSSHTHTCIQQQRVLSPKYTHPTHKCKHNIPDTGTRQYENVLDGTIHDPRGNLSQRLGHFLWLVLGF
jgi:hypothetical protein